jgi:hypothetical protein
MDIRIDNVKVRRRIGDQEIELEGRENEVHRYYREWVAEVSDMLATRTDASPTIAKSGWEEMAEEASSKKDAEGSRKSWRTSFPDFLADFDISQTRSGASDRALVMAIYHQDVMKKAAITTQDIKDYYKEMGREPGRPHDAVRRLAIESGYLYRLPGRERNIRYKITKAGRDHIEKKRKR